MLAVAEDAAECQTNEVETMKEMLELRLSTCQNGIDFAEHTLKSADNVQFLNLDPVHTGPDPYGHHINLKSLKTSMTLKFVITLQNLIKAYHRKSGKSIL